MNSEGNKRGEDILTSWMNEPISIRLSITAHCAGVSVKTVGRIRNLLGGYLIVEGLDTLATIPLAGAKLEVDGTHVNIILRSGGSCVLSPSTE